MLYFLLPADPFEGSGRSVTAKPECTSSWIYFAEVTHNVGLALDKLAAMLLRLYSFSKSDV